MKVKKQQVEPDLKQQTGSKLRKEYIKAVYCHLAYLTYMQNTSRETLGWKKHKPESRLLGEISILADKGPSSQGYGFPVVMYGCESWTLKKLSAEELMLLNCGVREDS